MVLERWCCKGNAKEAAWGEQGRDHAEIKQEWKRKVGERGRRGGKERKRKPGGKAKEKPSCEVAPKSV